MVARRGGRRTDMHLGPLERAVIEHVWAEGCSDVSGVHGSIGVGRRLTRNTIHSTLERLVRKQLLVREKRGRAFWYDARISRDEFLIRSVHQVLDSIPHAEGRSVLASFVDFAERTSETGLGELEELVRQRRRTRRDVE